jgi:hypothetical protein
MPTFTFTKSGDFREGSDPTVSMTFTTDSVEALRENFEDFLNGAGFVTKPEEDNVVPFERKLTLKDTLAKEEDWMWNDAVKSKFPNYYDTISFEDFTLGDK